MYGRNIDITKFTTAFEVRSLLAEDVEKIYELCAGNPLYYEYHPPFVTKEAIIEDFNSLPYGKSLEDKYYVGFYQDEQLIAILDLIDGYPTEEIAFIGFFMMDKSMQKTGVGTQIVTSVVKYLGEIGYEAVRLAWIKGNPQAEHFWKKNQFEEVRETESQDGDIVVLAERKL